MLMLTDREKLNGHIMKEILLVKMKFKDLVELYEEKRRIYGDATYRHISEIFEEAKKLHYNDWLKHPTSKKDHEQSWRAFKGKTSRS